MNNEEQHGENSPKGKRERTKSHSEPNSKIYSKQYKLGSTTLSMERLDCSATISNALSNISKLGGRKYKATDRTHSTR